MSNTLEIAALRESISRRIREGHAKRYMAQRISESEGGYVIGSNDTHFAVHKPSNKIVFSWDYADIDPIELRNERQRYFTEDIKDNDFNPNEIVVLNRKSCIGRNIDPSDRANWSNNPSQETAEQPVPAEAPVESCKKPEKKINESAGGRFVVHYTVADLGQNQCFVNSLPQLKQMLANNIGEDFLNRITYIDVCSGSASNLSEPSALITFGGEGGYWANVAQNNPKVAAKRKDIREILGVR